MSNDEIDEMLSGSVPTPHPVRWCGLDAESERALTESLVNRGHIGHCEGYRSDSFLPETGRKREEVRLACEKCSDDVSTEILSRTQGSRESGDDFVTAATNAVGHAVRFMAADLRDPAETAMAVIAGVLRAAGENEDTALKTLSMAATAVIREALLLGDRPTPWIEGVLSGAVIAAQGLGLDRKNAMSAAAEGILKGADEASLEARWTDATALKHTIHASLASLGEFAGNETPPRAEEG